MLTRKMLFEQINFTKIEVLFRRKRTGRPPISRVHMVQAYFIMILMGIKSYRDLPAFFKRDKFWRRKCGLDTIPHFTTFFKCFNGFTDKQITIINYWLISELRRLNIISRDVWAVDSTIIEALKSDTDARWGVKIEDNKEIYLYGYKIHLVVDAKSELPLFSIVTPANESDFNHCIPLLEQTFSLFRIVPRFITADKGYDDRKIIDYIESGNEIRAIIPHRNFTNIKTKYSQNWKKVYKKRTSVERVFDRIKNVLKLKTLGVKSIDKVIRLVKIACIGMLLVGLVAYHTKNKSKLRKIKWFQRGNW